MLMLTSLSTPSSSERSRLLSVDAIRQRALERLYERKAAVDQLIETLEDYQRSQNGRPAECPNISVVQRYLSGSAQSQI
jgi:hypothetical protein